MSDEMKPQEQQTNAGEVPSEQVELEAEGAGPTKPAVRRARSKPSSVPTEPPEEEIPLQGTSSAPPNPAQVPPSADPAAPSVPQAPLYGDGSNEEVPIGGAANSLYDAELEVRQIADQAQGQQAFMGNLAAGVLQLIGDNLRRMSEEQANKVNTLLRGIDLKDYLDPDFWRGIGMVLQYQIDEQVSFVKRRISGDYTTDPYGMDRELIEVARPFLNFMYRTWWRISAEGLENVPAEGRGLLVGNHSGVLPWDGAMIAVAVGEEHPAQNQRIVRSLHLHWFSSLPFIAPAIAALGNVPGLPENAVRLLEDDELVCVFPEGVKGVGKLFKDRYQLARFGRGGFVQAAIRAQAPIIPVAVVGAEEIYPMLANAAPIARLLGMPFFPITPFFPWLGPAGIIPLPTRWSITFCEPLPTNMYDPSEADDPLTVLGLSEIVRNTIQTTLDAHLAQRHSIF